MKALLDEIEDSCVPGLTRQHKNGQEITFDLIRRTVTYVSLNPAFQEQGEIPPEDLEFVCKRLQNRFDINMTLGAAVAEPFMKWLDDAKVDIDPYFWGRYERHLRNGGFPPKVVTKLDEVTDRILGYLENPKKEGKWIRKGLVVGHVQSGKTANYTGLVCKAADAGYRLIIVMAGIHNNLRNQTQRRIDAGFVGRDSSKILANIPPEQKLVGVGLIDADRKPSSLTTSNKDFNKAFAQQQVTGLGEYREAVVLVIKKNKSTLENLIGWLKSLNLARAKDLIDYPMLLIDDEADNASLNTNEEGREATTINRLIRELLHSFHRRCYLGYTATPFANIFVDPDTDSEMLGDDLFPRDFIISLDAPDNYFGATRVFSEDSTLDVLRELDDFEDILPLKHKKDFRPPELPGSLLEAVRTFLLVRAARMARSEERSHNSMLVNVSRFTDVQSHIRELVHLYLDQLRTGITNHYQMPVNRAIMNPEVKSLYDTWHKEFSGSGVSWEKIQSLLHSSAAPVRVVEVNSSRNSEPLNYEEYNNSLNVIAVGGISLSRGLTLEGLTVSYFLRNSIMYDTLMQMGRWFGYRDGYDDLCRIYMTSGAISWYRHIAEATEELRNEFVKMERSHSTPSEFGLAVRSHPDSLIVTARNKMRTAETVVRSVSLAGRLIESTVVRSGDKAIEHNQSLLGNTVRDLLQHGSPVPQGNHHLWQNIPADLIKGFISEFDSPFPLGPLTQREPLFDYIDRLDKAGQGSWDVALMSVAESEEASSANLHGLNVWASARTVEKREEVGPNAYEISGSKRRVASTGDERIGLSDPLIEGIRVRYRGTGRNVPDWEYRQARTTPLLMLHRIDCRLHKSKPSIADGVVAYGISFPGEKAGRKHKDLVEYKVNVTWYRGNFGDDASDEELPDE
ncbi:Z1 domain-containing protein [Mariprofundus ferrooxydans]|uniref:Z1 domain-containing protein n=1 Tax=Mariprofundus ferrooxydans TaxID=314344 RepID=UPI0014322734|nr:Z1 domain-containing protein [Mariprofundus ferrooxydans]